MSYDEFSKDTLTEEEAFWVMWYFIEGQYKMTNGTIELSDVLSFSQPFEFNEKGHFDGKVEGNRRVAPADNGMVSDWNDAVKKLRTEGAPKPTPLKK